MSRFIARTLAATYRTVAAHDGQDGLDLAHAHSKIVRVGENASEQLGSRSQIAGEFGEEIEKFSIAGDEAHGSGSLRHTWPM